MTRGKASVIEEIKNKISLLEKELKESEKNSYKVREKLSKTRAKLEKAESDAIIEDTKFMIGKYWYQHLDLEDRQHDVYLKVNDIRYDSEYYEETVAMCESIEICWDGDELRWYSYMKEVGMSIRDTYIVGNQFNPKEMKEIIEEEFYSHKKV